MTEPGSTPTPRPAPPPHTSALMKSALRMTVFLYRLTGGAIGGRVGPESVLLLTTIGRKSGQRHTIPVSYFEDGATLFVIASNAGREQHPAWYLNLVAHPQAEVEIKRDRRSVLARVASSEERERLLAYAVAKSSQRAEPTATTRQIPVVILQPATSSSL
ncbi:MAG TPA: nitroreductase/quinone reductase family protein [Ktedonobacterales bacterium]|nr:nitroreductase/quinone reductase family protein [Ktedonobacterales bacterium]